MCTLYMCIKNKHIYIYIYCIYTLFILYTLYNLIMYNTISIYTYVRIIVYIYFIYIIYKANSLESQLKFKLNNKKNIVERENELFTTSTY